MKYVEKDDNGGMTIEQQDIETAYGLYPCTGIDCDSIYTNVQSKSS